METQVVESVKKVDSPLAHWLDRRATRPMFALSIVYLAVAAGVIHRIGQGHVTFFEVRLIAWFLVAMWPIFAVDAIVRFTVTCRQMSFWPRFGVLVGVLMFPWLRLGLRSYADPRIMWLPWLGWHIVDRTLRRRLERFFSVPMIVFALLVLPVFSLEYFWETEVREHFFLALALDICSSIIWMAFAIEFTVSVSVAEKKLAYCLQNWMDLAVVALPIIDFLPILRLWQLGRLVQLNQIGRLGRLYRLRGLILKAWRAILLLEMISRIMGNYKARRLQKLKDLAAAKEIELEELRQEMAELELEIKREAEECAAKATEIPPAMPQALPQIVDQPEPVPEASRDG